MNVLGAGGHHHLVSIGGKKLEEAKAAGAEGRGDVGVEWLCAGIALNALKANNGALHSSGGNGCRTVDSE